MTLVPDPTGNGWGFENRWARHLLVIYKLPHCDDEDLLINSAHLTEADQGQQALELVTGE